MGLTKRLSLGVVSLLFAGCGSVVGPKQSPDGGRDAFVPDADETGMATVVTHTHAIGGGMIGAIEGMVDIVSIRPNGTMLEMTKTDASGQAAIHVYPGGHGFACDERGSYNEASTKEALERTLKWLTRHVG